MAIKHLAAACTAAALLALGTVSAQAADRHVTVKNGTSWQLRELYGSNVGTDDWQEDILGRDVLEPGESVDVNFDDGSGACKFDFKGVFADGEEVVSNNVDVCSVGKFTFTE